MLASVSMFAQWSKPEVKGTDFVVGDTLYLYNVEAAAFFRGLGEGKSPYWGSRAGVATEGCDLVVFQPALYDLATGAKDAIEFMEEWDESAYIDYVHLKPEAARILGNHITSTILNLL